MSDQEKKEPANDQSAQASGQRSERGARERKGRRRHNAENRPLDESVNMDELRSIVELISEHGFTDFELENKDVRVRLRRELAPQIVSMPGTQSQSTGGHTVEDAGAKTETMAPRVVDSGASASTSSEVKVGTATDENEGIHMITSPIVGTFFRAPSPNAEPFVRIGSQVHADSVVCIIEAMKLMNEIQAELTGVVEKIYVENGQPVEFGQPLFGIKQ
jgi:acetyl-CoA carboxylase biotin carboxyl carrier protein